MSSSSSASALLSGGVPDGIGKPVRHQLEGCTQPAAGGQREAGQRRVQGGDQGLPEDGEERPLAPALVVAAHEAQDRQRG